MPGALHHGGRRAGQLHRQMERQRLVGLGLGDERRLCLCAGGERDQSLCRGRVHDGGRGGGQLHRQMGRQRLVGPGLGDGRRLSSVYALAADGAGHLFVGGDFYLAGTNVSPFIAQANLGSVPTILTPPAKLKRLRSGATVHFARGRRWRPAADLSMVLQRHQSHQLQAPTLVDLTNVQFSQSGAYTVVVTNRCRRRHQCAGHAQCDCGRSSAGRFRASR